MAFPQAAQVPNPHPQPHQLPAGLQPAIPGMPVAPAALPQGMGSIMDLFSGRSSMPLTPAQQAQAGPASGGPTAQPAAPAGLSHVAPGTAPTAPAQPNTPGAPASPMDDFTKLLQTTANGPQSQPATEALNLFNTDPAKVMELVRAQNFVGNIDAGLAQRALGGDLQALQQLLNAAQQNTFLQATMLTSNMLEQGLQAYDTRLNQRLPESFRTFATSQAVAQQAPAAQHEALRPVVENLQSRILANNPGMPPHEVAKQIQSYLVAAAQAINPQAAVPLDPQTGQPFGPQAPNVPGAVPQTNWGAWLGGR